ncbi:ATP-dependent metallopeptidase FtsH/Yme1/Tma family protein [Agathobacter rectalis]|jgi:cell division protease FtsH|uniref:ATP-dependent zinc metalloprotease FtsH n=1 Tax=Agathobacter rectalis TaxID=39491 RepID=A0A3E4Y6Y9_9FIRM|nr:ATP-dependent zinc metalloprotease FtsH [Agathobacter rectalis]RGM69891.1 ATP-dependent metallopeptidase FtsH/Yme1/Tma family protein [Agathobacter rectalis]RGT13866.1 ATP-dependent metallopeptidase FtsH/Yme1/Tma family protein [Agathobacter rectalis]RGT21605.1 ATP-dependent metallopeptidase FtsH/Yme1/Tma family protein [Agathobacter rectalis]RHE34597.1 ATP-dependent metallopeptidase FtsH/Yme1/Tma family protein [Agathobacter rectalis]
MDNQGPNNYNYNNGPGNNGSGGNGNNGGNRPGGNGGRNNRGGQGIMAFILLTLVALFVYALISNSISHASTQEKSYSDFIKQLDKGNVKSVEFDSYEIDYKLVDDGHKDYDITYYTGRVADDELVPTLKKAKTSEGKSIEIKAAIPDNTSTWIFNILSFIVPLILLWVLLAFVSKKMGGSMGMGVGKSTAKVYVEKSTGVNFKDVAGQDEAKESLQEVVDFLHNPKRYTDIGAKLPKGALLVGPPGTGKTLLAKAVAGEAGVPFFSLAGSDFVEMFVGVGASRVRDLFKEAQKMAPCIIFIDEIDAIGKSRDSRYGGGNDEREQTLNQLLAEMDGFDTSKGLLILAATNRPEVLDKALLRPGRFDRRIIVDKPDLKGRLETLKVHSKDVKMDESVDLDALALATAGLVGSDLANMINEAAINAVKNGRQLVNQSDLFEAFELVAVGGKEKKDRVMSDKERKIVSYHEVGHALVSALQKNTEPVQKITIVPRTMGALGYTLQTPEEEKYLETKDELLAKITTYMAGRAAEVLVFNSVTSGAANDIENATKIARAMVTMYGMSDKFGMMCLATVQNQYLEGGAGLICGENTASQIDDEVLSIINSSYAEAMKLLDENREILDSISDYLYEKETITGKEFMKMFRDMKGLPDPDEENKEQEATQNDAQKDVTSATDPLLRNAIDKPADTNESSGYTAPDDTSNN